MNTVLDDCVKVPEIAQAMGLSERTIRNSYIGEIKLCCDHYKIGKSLWIDKEHFRAYLKKQKTKKVNPIV